jgi:hypothetical protein
MALCSRCALSSGESDAKRITKSFEAEHANAKIFLPFCERIYGEYKTISLAFF